MKHGHNVIRYFDNCYYSVDAWLESVTEILAF